MIAGIYYAGDDDDKFAKSKIIQKIFLGFIRPAHAPTRRRLPLDSISFPETAFLLVSTSLR